MNRLELPITIHTANENEVPKREEILNSIRLARKANIVEGYTFSYNPNTKSNFIFYSEININNSRLWSLFISLARTVPTPTSLIYGMKDGDDCFGDYVVKDLIMESISKFKTELVEDGYIQFGLIHSTKEALTEVFVDCSKYIKYWGVDQNAFLKIMVDFNLKESVDLRFIDEFPKVTEALRLFKSDVTEPEEIIKGFNKEFRPLQK